MPVDCSSDKPKNPKMNQASSLLHLMCYLDYMRHINMHIFRAFWNIIGGTGKNRLLKITLNRNQ